MLSQRHKNLTRITITILIAKDKTEFRFFTHLMMTIIMCENRYRSSFTVGNFVIRLHYCYCQQSAISKKVQVISCDCCFYVAEFTSTGSDIHLNYKWFLHFCITHSISFIILSASYATVVN